MHPPNHRIVVTGANGFLGRAICRLALEAGCHVTAIVRRLPSTVPATGVVLADLLDPSALEPAFRGASAIVHAAGLAHVYGRAAQDDAAFHTVNVRGTDAVLDAALAAGVPHLVLVSSVSVYGGSLAEATDESSPPLPATPYARSKWKAELHATERFAPHGALTILRFATIYGEDDRGNVSRLIRTLKRGRFVWPGSGLNRKSLIYKDDAARACLAAVQQRHNGVYNVSDPPVTMREIVTAICLALDRPLPQARIPAGLIEALSTTAATLGPLKPIEQLLRKFLKDDLYSAERFLHTFHCPPQIPLKEGIAREVRSMLL